MGLSGLLGDEHFMQTHCKLGDKSVAFKPAHLMCQYFLHSVHLIDGVVGVTAASQNPQLGGIFLSQPDNFKYENEKI